MRPDSRPRSEGGDINRCFNLTSLPSGTKLYRSRTTGSDEYWWEDFSGAGYSDFVCSAAVGVEAIATWSNGNVISVATGTEKPKRSC